MSDLRPTTVLIAALGGEGGGVLADWVVAAARAEGLWVQATSIPGVAQRTGATTYYIEMMAKSDDGRRPVFALTASPGNIDLMVASELLEAGRAVENGYVSPERTTVIASTHRFYAMAEKTATTDGRYDADRIVAAVEAMARKPVLDDLKAKAEAAGAMINAVLLGAMAGSGTMPVSAEALKQAIADGGIAVAANLRGFEAGLALARGDTAEETAEATAPPSRPGSEALHERIDREFPEPVRQTARRGVDRLVDYQGDGYARVYLDRLMTVVRDEAEARRGGFEVSVETARRLALWMAFEDLIRVADLKTRPDRLARVRKEVRAGADQMVTVTEFLKPGAYEWASLMPPWMGRGFLGLADRLGLRHRLNVGMRVTTTSVAGFAPMWMLSRLRGWRPHTLRYAEEQARIEAWLDAVRRSLSADRDVALMVARSAKMVRGYSDTHARGVAKHGLLLSKLDECLAAPEPAAAFRPLLDAAMDDPEGDSLERLAGGTREAA
jgi:indolepyruvate ferredoxin oxidoreductase beta subunit